MTQLRQVGVPNKELLKEYIRNPVRWAHEVLGIELDPWQQTVLMEAVKPCNPRTAVCSGNGIGKTLLLAVRAYHFLMTRPNAIIPCTAPSKTQLFDAFWRECYKLYDRSPILNHYLEYTATKITKKYNRESYMVARTAVVKTGSDTAESLQGMHEKNLLFCVDEGSGVPDPVMSAVENAGTKEGNYIFVISNPTRNSGAFYDIFHKFSHRWLTFRINTEELLDSGQSCQVNRDFITRMEEQYGKGSALYGVKVLGEFPSQELEILVPQAWFDRAVDNYQPQDLYKINIGWDIATRGPDSTCRATFYNNMLESLTLFKGLHTDQIVLKILEERAKRSSDFQIKQYVDALGLGDGVTGPLRNERMVVPVYANQRANDAAVYDSLFVEASFKLRRAFEKEEIGINPKISNIKLLREDFCDRLYTTAEKSGRITLEAKDLFRKRHQHRSPDCGDATVNGFMGVDPTILRGSARPGSLAVNIQTTKTPFFRAATQNRQSFRDWDR